MTLDELQRRIREDPFVTMPATEWHALAPQVDEIERHATGLAGDLVVVRIGHHLAAVEEPSPRERVVRRFADADEMRRFVRGRRETYDRMWDGCGCRVDYYS